MLTLELQLAAVLGYLLGSIPFGLVLTRIAGLGDIRTIGSGNIGATNVLRTGRKGLALATLLLDGGKGAVAAALGGLFTPDCALIAGLFAVIGHNFPLWLRFQGGKGVATSLGVITVLSWPVGLIACLVWLGMAALFRLSSLSALTAFLSAPAVALLFTDNRTVTIIALLTVLAVLRHHANIKRLLRGEEPKIGSARSPQP